MALTVSSFLFSAKLLSVVFEGLFLLVTYDINENVAESASSIDDVI